MIIRTMVKEDIDQLKTIHKEFYNEFPFPDFSRFLTALVIVENDKIITGGGLVAVPEMVALTDKNQLPMKRYRALLQFLESSEITARSLGAAQIHAFIQDEKWEQQLLSVGFNKVTGTSLVMNL